MNGLFNVTINHISIMIICDGTQMCRRTEKKEEEGRLEDDYLLYISIHTDVQP